MDKPVTAPMIKQAKGQRRLSMLTAYDYPFGLLADKSGVDMILIGDSLAMVVLGHEDTLSVTLDEMIHHCKPVSRAVTRALVIGDMPFMSYEPSVELALINAGRMVREGGVRAVKLEGAGLVLPQVEAMVQAGIPVQGHIGLTPQRVAQLGGFKVQGKTAEAAKKLVDESLALAEAGCFSIVLEAIPAPIAEKITEACPVPTIGIGAGVGCDGQVLVIHDILGLYDQFLPKFAKQYAKLSENIGDALTRFREEVEQGSFPGPEHSFSMDEDELKKLY
ncbi:MAG: 3-methyl-2-oxobutanoate hydroxymethyltransferase [Desulfovibrio sp.]|nr:MAG: 3-methyl-2-oxobutanoate hydroxymethyltransferase [Desulfovibrio sp.]